jgi:hypothetical protein
VLAGLDLLAVFCHGQFFRSVKTQNSGDSAMSTQYSIEDVSSPHFVLQAGFEG